MAQQAAAAAPFPSSCSHPAALFYLSWALLLSLHTATAANPHFDCIYAFGDSLTDTGNSLLYQRSINVDAPERHLPYGRTFFQYPTGRISDGRLVIDFLASKLKAPHFLLPFLGLNQTRSCLVNFAIGGGTALNVDYLKSAYNLSIFIPYSLDKQLDWFSTLPVSTNKGALSETFIYFGEIGGNDYNAALFANFTVDRVIKDLVPDVLKVIRNALEFLIANGAKRFVVEGGYPIGCPPVYTQLEFVNATKDKYECVAKFHKLNKAHDRLLKKLLHDLYMKYSPNIHIVFFDQLKAYAEILKHPTRYGFTNTVDPCFGILHSTNFSNVEACHNSSTYVNWDGFHYTEAANRMLFNLFFTKGFVTPYPNFLVTI